MADEHDRPSGGHEDPTAPRPEDEWTSSDASDPFARPAGSSPGENRTEPVPRNPTQPVPPPPGAGQGPAYGSGQPPGEGPAYGPAPGRGAAAGGSYGPPPPGADPYGPPSGAPSHGSPSPYGTSGAGYGSPSGPNQPGGQYGQPPYGSGPAYGSPYSQPQQPTTNVSAIVLTVLSGLSMLACAVTQLPALIFGIIALSRMSNDPEGSRRMSRYGWIAFAIGILVIILFIVGIIALVAVTDGGGGYDYQYNTY